MAKKGTMTREMIVAKAAELFNSLGYFRASMSDLMAATGLEKGGIYNHFGSKDELALAAFEYAVGAFGSRLSERVKACDSASEKLHATIDHFKDVVHNPPLPGGCPLLNGAVESDNAHPALREKVQGAMKKFLQFIETMIAQGVENGNLKSDVDAHTMATFIVASLEGGMMLSMLYEDPGRIDSIATALHDYINNRSNV